MAAITEDDWGKIHAKAWTDSEYREILETDPTEAIRIYAEECGHPIDRMVKIPDAPSNIPQEFWEYVCKGPPACC